MSNEGQAFIEIRKSRYVCSPDTAWACVQCYDDQGTLERSVMSGPLLNGVNIQKIFRDWFSWLYVGSSGQQQQ